MNRTLVIIGAVAGLGIVGLLAYREYRRRNPLVPANAAPSTSPGATAGSKIGGAVDALGELGRAARDLF